ncbi:hypothetical protein TrRE_jg2607, partial [Triparma retinervis]
MISLCLDGRVIINHGPGGCSMIRGGPKKDGMVSGSFDNSSSCDIAS